MISNKTIESTTKRDLCISCGTCKAVCPTECITSNFMGGQYLPEINLDECVDCGKCYRVCPGIEVNYLELYDQKNWNYPENIFEGRKGSSYITFTKDKAVHKKASSGGIISTLLINLIETGRYDKAFVVDCDVYSDEEVKSTVASKKEEILSAAKSKYLPVSMENVINHIQESPQEKIIVIGTSCHLHGIHKFLYEENYSDDNILFLGLFCEKTLNLNIIDYYAHSYSKDKGNIIKFNYKDKGDNGWPGNSKLVFDSGREKFVDRKIRMWLKPYFQLQRCLFCIDKLNQLADISFGDCYIKGEESYLGKSNIIIRTSKGEEAFKDIKEKLEYKEIDFAEIAQSQNIRKKIKNLYFDYVNEGENINIVKNEFDEDIDENKYKQILDKKKNKIMSGKNYTSNKQKIITDLKHKKFKYKLQFPKRVLVKILAKLGLKAKVKEILRGGYNNG